MRQIGVDRDQARALASRTAKTVACGHDPADGAKLRHHGRQMPFKIRVGADKEETPRHGFCPRPVSATRRSIPRPPSIRSEEHTSELQSLMRISYAVFCLNKKK